MPSRRQLIPCLFIACLSACGSPSQQTDGNAAPAHAEVPAHKPLVIKLLPIRGTTVTLLDAGQEPRIPLRFTPASGDRQVTETVFETNVPGTPDQTHGGEGARSVITYTATWLVTNVGNDGTIEYKRVVTEPRISDGVLPATTHPEIDAMFRVGQEISCRRTNRGFDLTRPMKSDRQPEEPKTNSATAGLEMSSLLELCLPEEPVGPGARWKVARETGSQASTMIVDLDSINDGTISVRYTSSAEAHPSAANTATGADNKYHIISPPTGAGSGVFTWNLRRITSDFATGETTTQIKIESSDGEKVSTVVQDFKMKMEQHLAPSKTQQLTPSPSPNR